MLTNGKCGWKPKKISTHECSCSKKKEKSIDRLEMLSTI